MTANNLHPPDTLPEDFHQTPDTGLREAEAFDRARQKKDNRTGKRHQKSVPEIVAGHLLTPFNLLNLLLAALLMMVGAYRNMLFLGVVVSNTVIGTVQELRARRTIARLTLLAQTPVRTVRESRKIALPQQQLVEGDLVLLRAGDQVPADAVVLKGTGAANESLLTGESRPVAKRAGDWLLSGSYLSAGSFTAQLVYVGEKSYANRLTREARAIRNPKSELMRALNRLVHTLAAVILPLGAALFARQYFLRGVHIQQAVTSTVAAMIGMIPEGLILLTSVALMVGVTRLGQKNTLVSQLYGIENLARVDTLCVDKTGTLTTGQMRMEQLVPIDGTEAELRKGLRRFLGAFDCQSATLGALAAAVGRGEETPVAILPFSSDRKLSAASFEGDGTYILGAPAMVLKEKWRGGVRASAEALTRQGLRVLALCRSKDSLNGDTLPPVSEILGLCALGDVPRANAAQTLRYFAEQGVRVKVISGDDAQAVSAIASRLGLKDADRAVDLSGLPEEEWARAAAKYNVFGRVTPEGKRRLVQALQQAGHSVAMTGDGVNDIPAMKTADCSIAMASGSEAARKAAQLVLLTSDFAALPAVVAEGRRVINNITRASSLFLVKTLYSFALSLIMLFVPAQYPFQPIQLTLISSLTIGLPSFFLALEPNRRRVRGDFLRTVLTGAAPGAVAVVLCANAAMLMEHAGWSAAQCSTIATLAAGLMGLMALLLACQPFTRQRAGIFFGALAAFVLTVTFWGHMFYLVPLTARAARVLIVLCCAGALVMLLVRRWLSDASNNKPE